MVLHHQYPRICFTVFNRVISSIDQNSFKFKNVEGNEVKLPSINYSHLEINHVSKGGDMKISYKLGQKKLLKIKMLVKNKEYITQL